MRTALAWILSLGLTLLVGWLIYASVPDWEQSWRVTLQGRPLLLLAGFGMTLLHMVLRAWRWGVLLTPVKHPLAYTRLFSMTLAKYVINLIPPRAGELVASLILAKRERIPVAPVIATSLLERMLDLVTVFVAFGLYLVLFPNRHPPGSAEAHDVMRSVQTGSFVGLAALGLVLLGLYYLVGRREGIRKGSGRLRRVIASFTEGFRTLRQGGDRGKVIAQSLAIWIAITLQMWLLVKAYLIDFPLSGAFLLMVITVVGVAVPTPGGVGGFQFFMNLALVHFFPQFLSPEDPNSQAAGISNGCYMVSMIPVLGLGLILLHREGLSWGRISDLAREKPVSG